MMVTGRLSRKVALVVLAAVMANLAYTLRTYPMATNGPLVQNFDAQFNYRATEYLVTEGWDAFHAWYDDEVWYPFGRPTNNTMYPGMQYLSAAVYGGLNQAGLSWSLPAVCCYISAWLAPISAVFTAGIAYEATGGSIAAFGAAGFIMALNKGHLLRSNGAGYDNEHVAIPAFCGAFYFWMCAIRPANRRWFVNAVLAGACHGCIAWTWGGYVIVPNIIGLSVLFTTLHGSYSLQLNKAYTVFYLVGTALSTQVPIIGNLPFTSLELLGPMGLVAFLQLWQVTEQIRDGKPERYGTVGSVRKMRLGVFSAAGALFVAVVATLIPSGYFGPFSSRVRALVIQVPKTGNPLVDSVAEHAGTDARQFWSLFGWALPLAFLGLVWDKNNRDAPKFFLWHATMGLVYVAFKMTRFLCISSIGIAAAGGVAVGLFVRVARKELLHDEDPPSDRTWKRLVEVASDPARPTPKWELRVSAGWASLPPVGRKVASVLLLVALSLAARDFSAQAHANARMSFGTGIRFGVRTDMEQLGVWFQHNTPKDTRIFSWWDYGYGISNWAKRTTLADGNTCNHEHIALIGRAFVSPVEEGHLIASHLADYVWIHTNAGPDMEKAGHMARIAQSVFPNAVNASRWYFTESDGNRTFSQTSLPSPMVKRSLLYNLHWHGRGTDVSKYFEEVELPSLAKYHPHALVIRVFRVRGVSEESRSFCRTHRAYPPGLGAILAEAKDFRQLEDFNRQ